MRISLRVEVDLRARAGLRSEPRPEELKIAESNALIGLLLFAVVLQGAESSFDLLRATKPRGKFFQQVVILE